MKKLLLLTLLVTLSFSYVSSSTKLKFNQNPKDEGFVATCTYCWDCTTDINGSIKCRLCKPVDCPKE